MRSIFVIKYSVHGIVNIGYKKLLEHRVSNNKLFPPPLFLRSFLTPPSCLINYFSRDSNGELYSRVIFPMLFYMR